MANFGNDKIVCCMEAPKTVFTPAQLHMLEMMSHFKSDSDMAELQQLISGYYEKKVQEEADRLWDEGVLDAEAIEKIGKVHMRTPYHHSK